MNSGQFKQGVSGNSKGRPKKGYSITEMMREMMSNEPDTKEELARAVLDKAIAGDISAIKLIWNYMDGSPQQTVETKTTDIEARNDTKRIADTLQSILDEK